MKQDIYAIILAGGSGQRLKSEKPKQFLTLGNKPLISWSIDTFLKIESISRIIIACSKDYFQDLEKIIGNNKQIKIVEGGGTRQESAYNALKHIDGCKEDIIIIHDAARPFISSEIINDCIVRTREKGAAAVYVPAIDTLTEIENDMVKSIPSRNRFYYAQTPQVFKYSVIKDAHEKALKNGISNASDDVSLVINAGYPVYNVEGDYQNIKVTSPVDFKIAQVIMQEKL